MADPIRVLTPVGRLVQGHPLKLEDVIDDRTKQPKTKPDGTKQQQVYVALAFPKSDPAFMATVWPLMVQAAQRDWPQGQYSAPAFAWKMVDGDGVDKQGKPYANREGFAGHIILKISSGYLYQVVGPDGRTTITDVKAIKRGDYLRAYVGIRGNAPSQTPGLYVNPDFVQLCGYGEEIRSGPDVGAVLAQAGGYTLPPGASSMPVASTPMPAMAAPAPAPTMPGMPVGGAPVPQVPVAAPAPTMPGMPQAPGVGYAPNPGFMVPPGGVR
jgi:hypothetical protein